MKVKIVFLENSVAVLSIHDIMLSSVAVYYKLQT
jgi:hypothetical protein